MFVAIEELRTGTSIPAGSPIRFRADISPQLPRRRKPYTIIEDCLLVPKKPLFPRRARDRSHPVVIKNLVGTSTSEVEIFLSPRILLAREGAQLHRSF